jgi:predicted RNA binding protein YcfA (HicA-like mRNA interferase family)
LSSLPRVSDRDLVRAFEKRGYRFDRQTGSHMILRTSAPPFRRLVVLDHREIAKRTLRAIMRQAGVTVDELIALL